MIHITNRSKHSKDDVAVHQTFKQKFVSAIKWLLRYILLRPQTWRWLIVNLPDLGEKIESIIRQIFDLLADF
jgi:hypothetical protein